MNFDFFSADLAWMQHVGSPFSQKHHFRFYFSYRHAMYLAHN
jgi:hypothetical protein